MVVYNQNVITTMQNRLLFLDIDGVLNSVNYYMTRVRGEVPTSVFEYHSTDLDPTAVDLLKNFVLEYNIDIVLSSTWRKLFAISEIKDLFTLAGWEGIPIIDFTPVLHTIRGEEIQKWYNMFESEYDEYVIIDDDADFLPSQLEYNFVHVSGTTGLLPKHIEQMKEKLRIK